MLTILVSILQERSQLGNTGSCEGISRMALQHATNDACPNAFVQQGDRRRGRDEFRYWWLELFYQPGLVRCQSPELRRALDESAFPHEGARLTSLIILINIQLFEDVVNRWNR